MYVEFVLIITIYQQDTEIPDQEQMQENKARGRNEIFFFLFEISFHMHCFLIGKARSYDIPFRVTFIIPMKFYI